MLNRKLFASWEIFNTRYLSEAKTTTSWRYIQFSHRFGRRSPLSFSSVVTGHDQYKNSTIHTMATNIAEAFQNGTFYSDNQLYRFVKLPKSSAASALQVLTKSSHHHDHIDNNAPTAFQTFILDKDEITLMLSSTDFDTNKDGLPGYQVGSILYRLITVDVVLAPTLVGFMAVLTRALADANISVLPFAAYSRDHIFVADSDFDKAMAVLESLQKSTK
jgi:hypothetical protein